jgi:hypothetical protein
VKNCCGTLANLIDQRSFFFLYSTLLGAFTNLFPVPISRRHRKYFLIAVRMLYLKRRASGDDTWQWEGKLF